MRKTLFSRNFFFALALAVLSASIALAAETEYDRAVATYLADKYQEALPLFQALNKTDGKNPKVHYYLALCYQQLDRDKEAAEEYSYVVEHSKDPAFREIVAERLLRTKRRLGQAPKAEEESATVAKNHAPVRKVIWFSTNWCSHCKRFSASWEAAKSRFGKSLSFEHYNAEDPGAYAMVQKYKPKAYPTLVYLDAKSKVIENHADAPKSEEFMKHLEDLGAKN